MAGLTAAGVFILLMMLAPTFMMYIEGGKPKARWFASLVSLWIIIMYTASCYTFNSDKILYESNDMLVALYQEQLEQIDTTFNSISQLNPDVDVLVNRDAPIRVAIETKARLIERLSEAKKVKYEAYIGMQRVKAVCFWVGDLPVIRIGED